MPSIVLKYSFPTLRAAWRSTVFAQMQSSISGSMDRVRIFFGFGSASVASTGAWPGVVLAVVTGALPGVIRAWPGSLTSTGCGKLDIAAGKFEKLFLPMLLRVGVGGGADGRQG